ncbi:uncharacterized protein [Leptinotarsa decemlineata]|uniref:uncharacterized protein n=1 Tax=Leptinotarsa decemlineata TaxID=7539 RepID=UPI003D304193
MNSFIENVNEGRGKKMLQILFVEESKADHEKMENRPQVETLQSNFVETSSVPVLEVAHPNSEGVYILTYNNENITADDVLKGEFLFDDTNIELQEVQLVTEVNNNNQEYEEQEEVKTYDQEVNIADDGNNVYEDDVSDKSDDYIPDENGYSSDREYEENENLENNVQQPILEFEKVQEEPQDQEIIEINRGTKNRLKNEKLWAKNMKKFKVNLGEAYQTKSGNLKQAKTVKEGCGDKLNNDTLNTPTLRVKQAYPIPPGITVLKKADLLSLCRENLIPRPYHPFFENLRTSTVGEVDEQPEDDDD